MGREKSGSNVSVEQLFSKQNLKKDGTAGKVPPSACLQPLPTSVLSHHACPSLIAASLLNTADCSWKCLAVLSNSKSIDDASSWLSTFDRNPIPEYLRAMNKEHLFLGCLYVFHAANSLDDASQLLTLPPMDLIQRDPRQRCEFAQWHPWCSALAGGGSC